MVFHCGTAKRGKWLVEGSRRYGQCIACVPMRYNMKDEYGLSAWLVSACFLEVVFLVQFQGTKGQTPHCRLYFVESMVVATVFRSDVEGWVSPAKLACKPTE